MTADVGLGFVPLLLGLEQRLVRELELAPRGLPAELASLTGELRGRPARLEARAYAGPRHAYARFVELRGAGLEIVNILIFARPELPLPVFGADLVGLGKEKAVVVSDLSPMLADDAQGERERAALARHVGTRLALELCVELPPWAKPWFSSAALCARVGEHESQQAGQVVTEMAEAFVQLSKHAEPALAQRAEVAERQLAYSAAHRADDRGLLLLRRIFEPAIAERFLCEVLFPRRIPA